MASRGHYMCVCNSDYADYFCACTPESTLLCKKCAKTHQHKGACEYRNLFPTSAYGRCKEDAYLHRLDKRIDITTTATSKIKRNLDLLEECKIKFATEVQFLIESITHYAQVKLSELEETRMEMVKVIEAGEQEAQEWIWKDRVLLTQPLGIAIRYYETHAHLTELFTFQVHQVQSTLADFVTFEYRAPQQMQDPDSYAGQLDKEEDEAHTCLREVLLRPHNQEELAANYDQLGSAKHRQGKLAEALQAHQQALKIRESSSPVNYALIASSYENIANVLQSQGRLNEALDYSIEALNILLAVLPERHISTANLYFSIGSILSSQGRQSEALCYFMKALNIRIEHIPARHAEIANSYNSVAIVFQSQCRTQEALDYHFKALKIQSEVLPANHPDLAGTFHNLAVVLQSQGRMSDALNYCFKALTIQSEVFSASHSSIANSYNSIGGIFLLQGRFSEALDYHFKSLNMKAEVLPANHHEITISYNNIAIALGYLGRVTEALDYYFKALKISRSAN